MRKADHYNSRKRAVLKVSREKNARACNARIAVIKYEQLKYAQQHSASGATISPREAALKIGTRFFRDCEKHGVFTAMKPLVRRTAPLWNPHRINLLNLLHSTPRVNIFKALSHSHQFPRPN